MSNHPQIYHGEWWVPAKADPGNRGLFPWVQEGLERHYTGTLTYNGDEDSRLELYHIPSSLPVQHYKNNPIVWGKDANGRIFTLFNVIMNEQHIGDISSAKFVVGAILIGKHILSAETPLFNACIVQYPYLRNFARLKDLVHEQRDDKIFIGTTIRLRKLEDVQIENGVSWTLLHRPTLKMNPYDLSFTQETEFRVEAPAKLSILDFLRQVEEFSQFLSIALYCKQKPTETKFTITRSKKEYYLLLKRDKSINPDFSSLLKYDLLKDKLPSMLKTWHENFERVAPITSYLIQSLKRMNKFDVPDFLIIAQALDGYNRRFVNHEKTKEETKVHQKKGRDKLTQYEKGIISLISQFSDVYCIQKCNIDPQVVGQSRDKYSHLLLDKDKPLAVKGIDLYWLTEKCKVLLTCCILNMIGLTNEDINKCCEQSPISQIIDSLPPE